MDAFRFLSWNPSSVAQPDDRYVFRINGNLLSVHFVFPRHGRRKAPFR